MDGDRTSSIIDKAHDDVWHFRVTMSDGRVFICGGMDATATVGFIHLRPVCPNSGVDNEVFFDGPHHKQGYVICERGVDVNQRYILSVEDGIS